MRNIIIAITVLFVVSGYSFDTNAQPIVVPNALTNVEGDTSNGFPFNCGLFGINSQRYQQIYAADQIGMSGFITALNFRVRGDSDPLGPGTLNGLQIDMSITPVNPENASNTFADNLGPVVETVFQGNHTFEAPACMVAPCPFNISIPINPFFYDPTQGNLIMDMRVPSCVNLGEVTFDSTNATPDTEMNRIYTAVPTPDGVDLPTGSIDDSQGIVTQFIFSSPTRNVPTLSEWGLIAMVAVLGVVGLIAIRRRVTA